LCDASGGRRGDGLDAASAFEVGYPYDFI